MVLAGVTASSITRICITHFHGDHCLGLPGVLGRLSLDRVAHPIDVYYPASGQPYFERLCTASIADYDAELRPHPVTGGGVVDERGAFRLCAEPLDHRADAIGWRLEEPDGIHLLPDALEAAGIRGRDIGRLRAEGSLGPVRLEDVSVPRPGQKFAFVMDTRVCDGARRLAAGVDLLVCESTFLETEADLADSYRHLTAAQAARLAADAGARRLVLTHYSQRHPDERSYYEEAAPIFPDSVAVTDLMVVEVPRRRE